MKVLCERELIYVSGGTTGDGQTPEIPIEESLSEAAEAQRVAQAAAERTVQSIDMALNSPLPFAVGWLIEHLSTPPKPPAPPTVKISGPTRVMAY